MIIEIYRLSLITEVLTQDTIKNTVEIKRVAETTLLRGSEMDVTTLAEDICFDFGNDIEDINED